jgi:hypothetical protein
VGLFLFDKKQLPCACDAVSNGCCDVSALTKAELVADQGYHTNRSKSGKSKGTGAGLG